MPVPRVTASMASTHCDSELAVDGWLVPAGGDQVRRAVVVRPPTRFAVHDHGFGVRQMLADAALVAVYHRRGAAGDAAAGSVIGRGPAPKLAGAAAGPGG